MQDKSVHKLIILAIQQRAIVNFTYNGLLREVEPYIFGLFENNQLILSGYQVGGESASHDVPAWKTFYVNKIKHFIVSKKKFFYNNEQYNPNDHQFIQMFAKIES